MSRRALSGGGGSFATVLAAAGIHDLTATSTLGAAVTFDSPTLTDATTQKTKFSVTWRNTTGDIIAWGEWIVLTKRIAGTSTLLGDGGGNIIAEGSYVAGTYTETPLSGATTASICTAVFSISSNKARLTLDPVAAQTGKFFVRTETHEVGNP